MVLLAGCGPRETGLHVRYGPRGIERLSFNGEVLTDLARNPSDTFHIWHMKSMDAKGKQLTEKQYGWGENNQSRSFDVATHTWLYRFVWGSASLRFEQRGNTLAMHVSTTNDASSCIIFHGLTIYPLVLHFPELPLGFGDANYQHLAVQPNDSEPEAEFAKGKITIVADAGGKPLYRGFEPAGGGDNFYPVVSSTAMDSMAASYAKIDRPLKPGESDTFTVSLVFRNAD